MVSSPKVGINAREQGHAIAHGCVRLRKRVIEAVLAQLEMTPQAVEAAAARSDPREDHMVSGRKR